MLQTYLSEYTIHLFSVLLFHSDVELRIHTFKISFFVITAVKLTRMGGGEGGGSMPNLNTD